MTGKICMLSILQNLGTITNIIQVTKQDSSHWGALGSWGVLKRSTVSQSLHGVKDNGMVAKPLSHCPPLPDACINRK
jgi:hypothetical protein